MIGLVDIGTKRKINDIVKGCPIDMNGVNPISNRNIIPLRTCNALVRLNGCGEN